MKILFTGGGTMGPVTPLLAVHEALKKIDSHIESVWIGTPHGPERSVVEGAGFQFFALPVTRCPRVLSLEWLFLPFRFLAALMKAAQIIRFEKPDVVASAGGYTAVPVVIAAKLFGVSVWVHHQDVGMTLTSRLTAPLAARVTVAWEVNRRALGRKARLVGNPVRKSVLSGSAARAKERFSLDENKPTIVIFGGGTGASWLNEMTSKIVERLLVKTNVIHLTGRGKKLSLLSLPNYLVKEFLKDEMSDAYAVADVIVCRAGMGTITELAALGKAAVMIPLPPSAQVKNAAAVADACVVLDQRSTTSEILLQKIESLLQDSVQRQSLGQKMHHKLRTDVADELATMVQGMAL